MRILILIIVMIGIVKYQIPVIKQINTAYSCGKMSVRMSETLYVTSRYSV